MALGDLRDRLAKQKQEEEEKRRREEALAAWREQRTSRQREPEVPAGTLALQNLRERTRQPEPEPVVRPIPSRETVARKPVAQVEERPAPEPSRPLFSYLSPEPVFREEEEEPQVQGPRERAKLPSFAQRRQVELIPPAGIQPLEIGADRFTPSYDISSSQQSPTVGIQSPQRVTAPDPMELWRAGERQSWQPPQQEPERMLPRMGAWAGPEAQQSSMGINLNEPLPPALDYILNQTDPGLLQKGIDWYNRTYPVPETPITGEELSQTWMDYDPTNRLGQWYQDQPGYQYAQQRSDSIRQLSEDGENWAGGLATVFGEAADLLPVGMGKGLARGLQQGMKAISQNPAVAEFSENVFEQVLAAPGYVVGLTPPDELLKVLTGNYEGRGSWLSLVEMLAPTLGAFNQVNPLNPQGLFYVDDKERERLTAEWRANPSTLYRKEDDPWYIARPNAARWATYEVLRMLGYGWTIPGIEEWEAEGIAQNARVRERLAALPDDLRAGAELAVISMIDGRAELSLDTIVNKSTDMAKLREQIAEKMASGERDLAAQLGAEYYALERTTTRDVVDNNMNPWAQAVFGVAVDPFSMAGDLAITTMRLSKPARAYAAAQKLMNITPEQAAANIARATEQAKPFMEALLGAAGKTDDPAVRTALTEFMKPDTPVGKFVNGLWLFNRTSTSKADVASETLYQAAVNLLSNVTEKGQARQVLQTWIENPEALVRGFADDAGEWLQWGPGVTGNARVVEQYPILQAARDRILDLKSLQGEGLYNPVEAITEFGVAVYNTAAELLGVRGVRATLPEGATGVRAVRASSGQGLLLYTNAKGKTVSQSVAMAWDDAQQAARELTEAIKTEGGKTFNPLKLAVQVQKAILNDVWLGFRPGNWMRNASTAATMLLGTNTPLGGNVDDMLRNLQVKFGDLDPTLRLANFASDIDITRGSRGARSEISGSALGSLANLWNKGDNPLGSFVKWAYEAPYGRGLNLGKLGTIPIGEESFYTKAFYTPFQRALTGFWTDAVMERLGPQLAGSGIEPQMVTRLLDWVIEEGVTGNAQTIQRRVRELLGQPNLSFSAQSLGIEWEGMTSPGRRAINEWIATVSPENISAKLDELKSIFATERQGLSAWLSTSPPQSNPKWTTVELQNGAANLQEQLTAMGRRAGMDAQEIQRNVEEVTAAYVNNTNRAYAQFIKEMQRQPLTPGLSHLISDYYAQMDGLRKAARDNVDKLGRVAADLNSTEGWLEKFTKTTQEYTSLAGKQLALTKEYRELMLSPEAVNYMPRFNWSHALEQLSGYNLDEFATSPWMKLMGPQDTPDLYQQALEANRNFTDHFRLTAAEALRHYPSVSNLDILQQANEVVQTFDSATVAIIDNAYQQAADKAITWVQYYDIRNKAWHDLAERTGEYYNYITHIIVSSGEAALLRSAAGVDDIAQATAAQATKVKTVVADITSKVEAVAPKTAYVPPSATAPKPAVQDLSGPAIWRNKDVDQPVVVTGYAGEHQGRHYYTIEGSKTGIPGDELVPQATSEAGLLDVLQRTVAEMRVTPPAQAVQAVQGAVSQLIPTNAQIRKLASDLEIGTVSAKGVPNERHLSNWIKKHAGIVVKKLDELTDVQRVDVASALRARADEIKTGTLEAVGGAKDTLLDVGESARDALLRQGSQVAEEAAGLKAQIQAMQDQWNATEAQWPLPYSMNYIEDQVRKLGATGAAEIRTRRGIGTAASSSVPEGEKWVDRGGMREFAEALTGKGNTEDLLAWVETFINAKNRLKEITTEIGQTTRRFAKKSMSEILNMLELDNVVDAETIGMLRDAVTNKQISRSGLIEFIENLQGLGADLPGAGPQYYDVSGGFGFTGLPSIADMLGLDNSKPVLNQLMDLFSNSRKTRSETAFDVGDMIKSQVRDLDEVEQRLLRVIPEMLNNPQVIPPNLRLTIIDLIDDFLPTYDTALQVATKTGEDVANFAMLNYNDRRNFDTILSFLSPYHYFKSRMGSRASYLAMMKPGFLNLYYETQRAEQLEAQQQNLPARMQGTFANPLAPLLGDAEIGGIRLADIRFRNPMDYAIPFSMYLDIGTFGLPADATAADRWARNIKQTLSFYPALEASINTVLDVVDPRAENSRMSHYRFDDFFPLSPVVANTAATGQLPAAEGFWSGTPWLNYLGDRDIRNNAFEGGIEGSEQYGFAQQYLNNQANGWDEWTNILPEYQTQKTKDIAAEGASGGATGRLFTQVMSWLTGIPMYDYPQGEQEYRRQTREYNSLGYDAAGNYAGGRAPMNMYLEGEGRMLPVGWGANSAVPGYEGIQPGESAEKSILFDRREEIVTERDAEIETAITAYHDGSKDYPTYRGGEPGDTKEMNAIRQAITDKYQPELDEIKARLEEMPAAGGDGRGRNPAEQQQAIIDDAYNASWDIEGKPEELPDDASKADKDANSELWDAYNLAREEAFVQAILQASQQGQDTMGVSGEQGFTPARTVEEAKALFAEIGRERTEASRTWMERAAKESTDRFYDQLEVAKEAERNNISSRGLAPELLAEFLATPKGEERAALRESDWQYTAVLAAAYDPELYDTVTERWGKDAWQIYGRETERPEWPEVVTDESKRQYYLELEAFNKENPDYDEIKLWLEGRYSWMWGKDYASKDFAYNAGEDYEYADRIFNQESQRLFGMSIWDLIHANSAAMNQKKGWKSDDPRRQMVEGYNEWFKDVRELPEDLSVADLPKTRWGYQEEGRGGVTLAPPEMMEAAARGEATIDKPKKGKGFLARTFEETKARAGIEFPESMGGKKGGTKSKPKMTWKDWSNKAAASKKPFTPYAKKPRKPFTPYERRPFTPYPRYSSYYGGGGYGGGGGYEEGEYGMDVRVDPVRIRANPPDIQAWRPENLSDAWEQAARRYRPQVKYEGFRDPRRN